MARVATMDIHMWEFNTRGLFSCKLHAYLFESTSQAHKNTPFFNQIDINFVYEKTWVCCCHCFTPKFM